MCGIAGIVDYKTGKATPSVVEKMLQAISYRGPDESGIYYSRFSAMGNVRLSILDLVSGQQPLSDQSGRFWIVYNGEIFNYVELKETLLKEGTIFKTESDSEVLVNLYAMHGKNCLSMLNGQFAFAIWDKQKEELFLARDRIGIRPLFYNFNENVFSFASEIKSIFEQPQIKREFDLKNLTQVYTFWTAITPNTAFRDIYELSPGHYLVYNKEGIKTEKYWSLQYERKNGSITLEDAIGQFDELFYNSVKIRLRADVEVAAYLSGGIDSSTTVSYIKNIEPGVLNTFSIGFEDKDFDESSYQNEAARYLNTNHKAIECTGREIADSFPKVVWHSETPLTRTAPVPMFILSRLVRENNIKVVITGEGADEMLAGYDIFKEAMIRRFWAKQPNSAIRPLLLKKLYPYMPQMRHANPMILKMFYGYKLEDTENPLYSHLIRWNNSNHIKKHFSDMLKAESNGYSPLDDLIMKLPDGFDQWGGLEKSQWLETYIFMSGYLLSSQGDRMAMANSVEGRYPFLDYRVIEFCNSLPANYKLNGLTEKYLLKKLMKNSIPESIVKRSKQAYRAPINSTFFVKDPPEYIKLMLTPEYFKKTGIFNADSVSVLLAKAEKTGITSEVEDMVLTAVISTHLLYNQFIEKQNTGLSMRSLKNLKTVNDN